MDIEKQIHDELSEYEQKEESIYKKKIEKMEKDYNKQTFALELENKKAILDQKKLIRKNLKKEVEEILKQFTTKKEYKAFLISKIEEALKIIHNSNQIVLSLVETDFKKYGNEIRSKYNFDIKSISMEYIGGCILEDKSNGVYIDNTMLNSVNEKIDSI